MNIKLRICQLFVVLALLSSCALSKPVKTGEMAFAVKQYDVAIELLEEEYRDNNDDESKYRKASLLAECFDILQNIPQSLKWYDIADQIKNSNDSNIKLAYALKKNQRYEDAASLFSEIYKKTKDQKYRSELEICKSAVLEQENQSRYDIESFSVNTQYSEYSPVFFEEDFIVFSSDRKGSTGNDTYKTTGNNFSDIYVMSKRGRQVHNFDAIINTKANEGTVCFNKTFDEMFFSRCASEERDGQFCKIFYTKRFNGYWVDPEPMMFFDDKTNFFHPVLIENDSVLIFAAAPNGSKTYDLYYSERVENGWTEAEIMPPTINTLGNEKFPTAYGDTLYFASDGHLGYGGLDIFKTHLKKNGSWSRPENLGFPINSGSDDFGLIVDNKFKPNEKIELEGFLSSSRNFANNDDIFSFSIYPEKTEEEPVDEPDEIEVAEDFRIFLTGRVVEVVHLEDDPNKEVVGKEPLQNAFLKISSQDTSFNINTNDKGRFLVEMTTAGNHNVLAKRLEYLTSENNVFLPSRSQLKADTTINVEIDLEKIVYNEEITIPNIYYDYTKWDIRSDAKPSLDALVKILTLNPQLNIELGSHTDCRGEEDYNQDLSQKRAESVVDYLSQKGINLSKLNAIGYGKSKLSIPCECNDCTEDQHQVNRRTTFKIIK